MQAQVTFNATQGSLGSVGRLVGWLAGYLGIWVVGWVAGVCVWGGVVVTKNHKICYRNIFAIFSDGNSLCVCVMFFFSF